MKNYLEQVLTELPLFFQHFSQCLLRPKRFISEQSALAEQPDYVSKGIEFLILSFLIALFISQVLPEAANPVLLPTDDSGFIRMASQAMFDLFMLFFVAVICFFSWRTVGVQGSFWVFFRLFAYFCGVALVLMVFADAITNIAMTDPVVAKAWIQLQQQASAMQPLLQDMLCHTDANTGELLLQGSDAMQTLLSDGQQLYDKVSQRPLFIIGNIVQAVIYLVLLVWLSIAWQAYGNASNISTGKIFLAALLSGALSFALQLVLTLIQSGSEMMTLYRNCAAG